MWIYCTIIEYLFIIFYVIILSAILFQILNLNYIDYIYLIIILYIKNKIWMISKFIF